MITARGSLLDQERPPFVHNFLNRDTRIKGVKSVSLFIFLKYWVIIQKIMEKDLKLLPIKRILFLSKAEAIVSPLNASYLLPSNIIEIF